MIGVVDYNIGNPKSIMRMCEVNGIEAKLVHDTKSLEGVDRLVLPGVGHFDSCISAFKKSDLEAPIRDLVIGGNFPLMGICVGAQMLGYESEEGTQKGLALIPHSTKKIRTQKHPVPHIGWETIAVAPNSPLEKSLSADSRFYFTHSFVIEAFEEANVCATFEYEYVYQAATFNQNVIAFQFHPEKSHRFGVKIFEWFCEWRP